MNNNDDNDVMNGNMLLMIRIMIIMKNYDKY